MRRMFSIVSGKPLRHDAVVVQPDQPSLIDSIRTTAVMVQVHTEATPRLCRDECARFEREICDAIRRIISRLRTTQERALPPEPH